MAGYSLQDYVNQFYRLLPSGQLWPTQNQSSADWLANIRAMVSVFQRVDEKANEWLTDYLPDVPVSQLEDWERVLSIEASLAAQGLDLADLSTAERQALVAITLQLAPQTVAELEALATPFGYTGVVTQPANGVRYSGFLSGQRYNGFGAAHAYMYEYMVSEGPDPDVLDDMDWIHSSVTTTPNDTRAPDGTLTAYLLTTTGSPATTRGVDTLSAGTGDTVQISAWARSDDTDATLQFSLIGDGTDQSGDVFALPEGGPWMRVSSRLTVPADGTYARGYLNFGDGSGQTYHVWNAYLGVVDPLLEYYLHRSNPAHARYLPRVSGDTQAWPLTYP